MLLLADFEVGYPSSPAFSSLWSFLVCHFQVLRIQRPRRGHCSHLPWRGAEFAGPENGGPKSVFRDIFVKSGSINVKPRPKWSPAHSTHTALSLYHTRCLRSDPAVRSVCYGLYGGLTVRNFCSRAKNRTVNTISTVTLPVSLRSIRSRVTWP